MCVHTEGRKTDTGFLLTTVVSVMLCFFQVNETKSSSEKDTVIHLVCVWLHAASPGLVMEMEERILDVCVIFILQLTMLNNSFICQPDFPINADMIFFFLFLGFCVSPYTVPWDTFQSLCIFPAIV